MSVDRSEPQTESGSMLIVADHPDASVHQFIEACRGAGWRVEEAADVYVAMGRLASSAAGRYARVIVDTRTLDEAEMAFLDLAPRYFAGLQVSELAEFVQGNGTSARRPASGTPTVDLSATVKESPATVRDQRILAQPAKPETHSAEPANGPMRAKIDPSHRPDEMVDEPDSPEPTDEVEVGLPDDGIPVGLDPEFSERPERPVIVGRIGPAQPEAGTAENRGPARGTGSAGDVVEPSLHEVVRMRMMPAGDAGMGARRVQRVPPGGSAPVGAKPGDSGESDELRAGLTREELDALLRPDEDEDGGPA